MLSDLRYVLRSLVRNRGFTFVTVVTLALGIGAAGAIFSVTDYVLFRINDLPSNVYLVGGQAPDQPFLPLRLECMARAYEGEQRALAGFAKAAYQEGNVVVDGLPVATGWAGVTPNFFSMLGIQPRVGRGFLPGDDRDGNEQVVVISHDFWQKHLGGRDDALGLKIAMGDAVCTVVGILRKGQALPVYLQHNLFRPLTYRVDPTKPWLFQFFCLARLAPGVTRMQAEAALRGAKVDAPAQIAPIVALDRVALASLPELNRVIRLDVYWLMLGAVGFLYAIACLNASNLMLVRMLGMRRELAIRLALGSGRRGIVRLLVLESATLALIAALFGVVVANWLFPLLLSATGSSSFAAPGWGTWQLDGRMLVVLGVLTVLTGIAIAFLPAWRVLRTDINAGLKDGGGALGEGRGLARLRGGLVMLQVAFAVVLLAGAGLMVRTFANFQKIDLGFDATGLVKIHVGFPPNYPGDNDASARLARLREIEAELARVPGVRAVGFGSDLLLAWYFPHMNLIGPGGRNVKSGMEGFGRGFETVAGLRLKSGHWLRESGGNEVLVNEALARSLWPDIADPTGQILRPAGTNSSAASDWKGWVVAGVVRDVRSSMRDEPGNFIYSPENWDALRFDVFVVRLGRESDPMLADAVRRRLHAFDPNIVVRNVVSLDECRQQNLWAENMANSVLRVLAAVALLLTVTGIFSVLAYAVDRRMAEFGVRMAFGATPRDLAQLVLGRGVVLVAAGLALGIAGAMALARFLQSLLFGVSGNDPWVLAGVGGVLLATAIAACVWPARRAARIDVTRLMRSE